MDARRRVARGHDGRCEVARVAGLRVREETGQRADERWCEPWIDGQRQAGPRGAPQRPYGMVVVKPQSRRLHLLLTSPLRSPVLEPHLYTEGHVNLHAGLRSRRASADMDTCQSSFLYFENVVQSYPVIATLEFFLPQAVVVYCGW